MNDRYEPPMATPRASELPTEFATTRMAVTALQAVGVSVILGGRKVVDEVSLQVRPGEWTAIVGPNGAGKSTLLATLAGVSACDIGQVTLDQRRLTEWPARERARRLAWMAQHGEADGDLAARDVVALGRLPHHGLFGGPAAEDFAQVGAAMRATECEAFAHRRLNALSGGERQRVLLARAFAVRAGVLLLDEPTSHLDPPHQQGLVRLLRQEVLYGTAVVTVLHDLTLAMAADRVVVMKAGGVVAEGAPADAALRDSLEAVFEHAFALQSVNVGGGDRWVAVPLV